MSSERFITVDFGTSENGEPQLLGVVAEQYGGTLVSDEDVIAKLGGVTDSIERVSGAMLDAVKRVAPRRAEVELTFGLAVEAGQLIALLGKAKGEASIRVLLVWEGKQA